MRYPCVAGILLGEEDDLIQWINHYKRELVKDPDCDQAKQMLYKCKGELQEVREVIAKLQHDRLLKELYDVAYKLDYAYCTLGHRGECTLTGDEYEKLMDVMDEVAEYLGIE